MYFLAAVWSGQVLYLQDGIFSFYEMELHLPAVSEEQTELMWLCFEIL